MENFIVTKTITKIGYALGLFAILIPALGGAVSQGIGGFFMGTLLGIVISIPVLVLCEMTLAVIQIAENTRKEVVK